jgi:hypothetical protein
MNQNNSWNTLKDNVNVIDGVVGEKPKSWSTSHTSQGIEDNVDVAREKPKSWTLDTSQGIENNDGVVGEKLDYCTCKIIHKVERLIQVRSPLKFQEHL